VKLYHWVLYVFIRELNVGRALAFTYYVPLKFNKWFEDIYDLMTIYLNENAIGLGFSLFFR
jgi:hypothetical protein